MVTDDDTAGGDPMRRPRAVSVVCPALNEAPSMGPLLEQLNLLKSSPDISDLEIIVVDDGSVDDTGLIADQGGARVIRHPAPAGYGRSLKDGVSHASHDVIVIMDADSTYPPEFIPQIVEPLFQGFNMVVGQRRGRHLDKGLLRRILKGLVQYTSGQHVQDVNSGMRAFRRGEVMGYFPRLCNTFSFTTSLTLAYLMTGRFVTYIDIPYGERRGRSRVRLFRESLRTLQFILQSAAYYNPIKFFLLLSALAVGLSLALIITGVATSIGVVLLAGLIGLFAPMLLLSVGFAVESLRPPLVLDGGRDP